MSEDWDNDIGRTPSSFAPIKEETSQSFSFGGGDSTSTGFGFGKSSSGGSSGTIGTGFGFGSSSGSRPERTPGACHNCGKTGHMSRECPQPQKERKPTDGKCFKCQEEGHMSRNCPKPLAGGEKPKERYVPTEDNTVAALFHNSGVGINFEKHNNVPVKMTGQGHDAFKPLQTFADANLSELLAQNVALSGYTVPTPVQKHSIPVMLAKRDLMSCAQTGSGKTAAYLLPIMTNILHDGIESSSFSAVQEPQALVLSPTRELAIQIFSEAKKFSYGSMIKSQILYGGVEFGYQARQLENGCNILIATPGRLKDFLEKGKLSLAKVKYFVLDEADRMLDMGFEKDIREIVSIGKIPKKGERCTFMFSATFPEEIQKLAQDHLHDYIFLTVGLLGGANTDVTQTVYKVSRMEKRDRLVEILNDIGNERTMVFIEHKKQADVISFFLLQQKFPTTSIHGDRLQSQREEALRDFKSGKSKIIVATSVAARGLDIKKVQHVINYDMPQSVDEYVHRIGRTGRCGNLGKSISFFDPTNDNDIKLARPLVRILTEAQQNVPEWLSMLAEDSHGSAFSGAIHSNDIRGKFGAMSLSNGSAMAAASTAAPAEEEEW